MVTNHRIQLAERHVAEAGVTVARQRRLVDRLKACNGYAHDAAELLSAFENSLAIFEEDLASLVPKREVEAGDV